MKLLILVAIGTSLVFAGCEIPQCLDTFKAECVAACKDGLEPVYVSHDNGVIYSCDCAKIQQ